MASVFRRERSPFWWAAITLPGGKRHQFSTKLEDRGEALEVAVRAEKATKRHQAEAHLRQAFSRIVEDVIGSPEVSVSTWLDGWLRSKANEVESGTHKGYTKTIHEAVAFIGKLGRNSLGEITVQDVLELRDHWATQNSITTANTKLRIFKMALNDAVEAQLITRSVGVHVRPIKNTTKQKRRPFTADQFKAILAQCDTSWRALCILGLYTGGQRFGDLATLRRRNVDLVAGIISTEAKKTASPIILPIVPALSDALAALDVPDNPDAFLFPKLAGITQQSRSNQFKTILRKAGVVPPAEKKEDKPQGEGKGGKRKRLTDLSFHSFRHMATTMLKAAGVGEGIAKAIVGHRSQAISDNYTHIPMETMREALEKLGRF